MQPSLTRLVAAVVDLHPGAQLPLLVSQRHHKRVHAVVVQRAAAVGRGHLQAAENSRARAGPEGTGRCEAGRLAGGSHRRRAEARS